ncbi:hypothetical protein JCM10207_006368 [Rhodosporidiobolus poonsookiae]
MTGKKSSSKVKLPSSQNPEYRAFYTTENDRLKEEHPGCQGSMRRKKIQTLWRKQHDPDHPEGEHHDSAKAKASTSAHAHGSSKNQDDNEHHDAVGSSPGGSGGKKVVQPVAGVGPHVASEGGGFESD